MNQRIRPIAIAIIRNNARILVFKGHGRIRRRINIAFIKVVENDLLPQMHE